MTKSQRIVLCPNCWGQVELRDLSCSNCGAEFEEYREDHGKETTRDLNRLRDVMRVASVVVIFLSMALLIVLAQLNVLHDWIRPPSENLPLYLLIFLAGVIVAELAFELNQVLTRRGIAISQNRRLIPHSLFAISIISVAMILNAESLDSILTSGATILYAILFAILLAGIALYLKSSDRIADHKRIGA